MSRSLKSGDKRRPEKPSGGTMYAMGDKPKDKKKKKKDKKNEGIKGYASGSALKRRMKEAGL